MHLFFKRLSIYIIAMVIFIAIGESYLIIKKTPSDYQWGWKYQSNAKEQTNQLGFRGQTINYQDSDYVVLLVGDSQVESMGTKAIDMPERRLEKYLSFFSGKPTKVFSIAAGGYGQDQEYLALLEYFAAYRADLVIVWETPENNVWNNLFPTHWPKNGKPKPTFWLDDDGSLAGPKLKSYPLRIQSIISKSILKESPDDDWAKRYLPAPYRAPITSDQAYLNHPLLTINEGKGLASDKTHIGLMVHPTSPRTEHGIRLSNKILHRMQSVTNENHAEFLTFYVKRPDSPLANGIYQVSNGKDFLYPELSSKTFFNNVTKMNEGLNFLMVEVTTQDYKFKNDPHLNIKGINQVMRKLASALNDR